MSNVVLKVTMGQLKKMAVFYQGYAVKPVPHSLFTAKKNQTTITGYNSGKVLFQGPNAESEANQWQSASEKVGDSKLPVAKNGLKKESVSKTSLPAGFSTWSVIGSDEVGNGSYFGPLTVCAVYASAEQLSFLKNMGVQDSKALTDARIITIAKQLLQHVPHSVINLMPEKYNEVQPTMSQGKMKALLHNQVLDQLLKKIAPEKPKAILVDQFELPSTYFKHIADQKVQVKENIHFQTKGESHHLAVAAASIIARYYFLKTLVDMTAASGYPIPSGAGANVDLIAADMYREGGLELLDKYTKLHFANTQKAIRLANR
ncbi:ribonuclease HIII [Trichococcus patagoniensis]|uniref:Ribonuclease HIII n=1 Tax=Trichococcus patagoniensis TaxID=382641 RepID=A0A2T5IKL4_9LACT|nr:ribonuclease HIII [Trichococcus patagoniensis]PTQ84362.1 ribonuclease HIII [Trichococcus patagoniensis]